MKQSSVIAFALILAFIVFITLRGELARYLGVFGLGQTSSSSGSAAPSSNSQSGLGSLTSGLDSLLSSSSSGTPTGGGEAIGMADANRGGQ